VKHSSTPQQRRKNQLAHVRIRAWERLGLHLSKRECKRIACDIQNKHAECIAHISFNLSVWKVILRHSQTCIVVYDKRTKVPATILTERLWMERSFKGKVVVDTTPLKSNLGDDPKIMAELVKLKKGRHNGKTG